MFQRIICRIEPPKLDRRLGVIMNLKPRHTCLSSYRKIEGRVTAARIAKLFAGILLGFFLTFGPIMFTSDGSHSTARADVTTASVDYEHLLHSVSVELKELRNALDRSTFDLEALVERLDYDPAEIIDFVKTEVTFQAYPGVLRGAQGTLMSAAGNALDQALLTATLLKDAGFDARIVTAQLDAEQTQELLLLIGKSEAARFNEAEKEAILGFASGVRGITPEFDQMLDDMVRELQKQTPLQTTQTYALMDATSKALLSELPNRHDHLRGRDITHEIARDVQEYFWVEMREGTAGDWIDIHPVFSSSVPDSFLELEKVKTFEDAIPSSLHQTVQLSVSIVQKLGSSLSEHQVMQPWSRPAANLYGKPITFSNIPDQLLAIASNSAHPGHVEDSELFFPQLNGAFPPNGQAFDLQGRIVPLDAAASHMSGVFEQVGDKILEAVDALAGLGRKAVSNKESAMQLVGQYVTVEIKLPDGTSRKFRRAVTPESITGKMVRDNSNPDQAMRKSLLQTYTIMVGAGEIPENYVFDQYLGRLSGLLDAFETLSRTNNPSLAFKNVANYWVGSHAFLSLLSRINSTEEDTFSFYRQPMVALYADYLSEEGSLRSRIDILSNSRRVIRLKGQNIVSAPQEAVRMGVWDTLIESLVLDQESRKGTLGTLEVIRAAQENGVGLRVLLPENVEALNQLPLSGLSKRYLTRDLSFGFAVVVPERMPFGSERETGWWRIHAESGETLGMLSNGGGTAMTERQVEDMISGVAVSGACVAAVVIYGKLINADVLTYIGGVVTCVGIGTLFTPAIPQWAGVGLAAIGAITMFVQFEVQRRKQPS